MTPSPGLPATLAARLAARETSGTLRRLAPAAAGLVDFASNDYLGLVHSGRLSARLAEGLAARPAPLPAGATGSRLLTGNSEQAEALETRIAAYHHAASALMFCSGYAANVGFFGSVPQRGDTVLYDEAIHASVRDGLRLSLAKSYSFRHNDLHDLERRLRIATGTVYVTVESLYSMDGDLAPLPELAALCQRHGLYLVVDEAHTTGIYGPGGAGRVVALGLEELVFARLLTFGKALGAAGAAWVGPGGLRDYLINFTRSFVYSTAPLPLHLLTLEVAYDLLPMLDPERTQLWAISTALNTALAEVPMLQVRPPGHIIHAVIPDDQRVVRTLAEAVRAAGFDARPIFSPTVAPGTARLRIIAHAHNTVAEALELTAALHHALQALPRKS